MKSQGYNQYQGYHQLHNQAGLIRLGAFRIVVVAGLLQDMANFIRQLCPVTKDFKSFQQQAGGQSKDQYRHGYRCHLEEEFNKLPARLFGDQQVLWLAYHRGDTTQSSTYGTVHNQAAKKGAELFQVSAFGCLKACIVSGIVIFIDNLLARGHLVIDRVEAHRDSDQHCSYCQGV